MKITWTCSEIKKILYTELYHKHNLQKCNLKEWQHSLLAYNLTRFCLVLLGENWYIKDHYVLIWHRCHSVDSNAHFDLKTSLTSYQRNWRRREDGPFPKVAFKSWIKTSASFCRLKCSSESRLKRENICLNITVLSSQDTFDKCVLRLAVATVQFEFWVATSLKEYNIRSNLATEFPLFVQVYASWFHLRF